jgi:acyl CoA:acetate/3-ketoacid CoA transferase alpha subunit
MKFKDFLTEGKCPQYVLDDFIKKLSSSNIHTVSYLDRAVSLKLTDTGLITISDDTLNDRLRIMATGMGLPYWPTSIFGDYWNSTLKIDFVAISFRDFHYMPNVEKLSFNAYDIQSLAGIEKLDNVTTITFDGAQRPKTIGLLNLMKMKNLQSVIFRNCGFFGTDANAFLKEDRAERIINTHLKSKSIPDFMDAMMEDGFKDNVKS